MPEKAEITQAPCNECGHNTDHWVLLTRSFRREFPEDKELLHESIYQMLECCGCHSVTLKLSAGFTKLEDPDVRYYPPPVSRRKPKWASLGGYVSDEIIRLLEEIYQALHADSRRLATMGTRALLDMVVVDKIGDKGTFDKKLTAFQNAGFISASQRALLVAALNAGHAASHRGHCPAPQELNHIMDVVETIIAEIYVFPEATEQLRKSVPPRKTSPP